MCIGAPWWLVLTALGEVHLAPGTMVAAVALYTATGEVHHAPGTMVAGPYTALGEVHHAPGTSSVF